MFCYDLAMIYQFGDFRLDIARQELWCGSEAVDVEPMVLDLLRLLIENHDRLVSKEELFAALWDDRTVTDSALSTCIKSARRAVRDTGRRQSVIKTVHGKGLRWVAPFKIVSHPAETAEHDIDKQEDVWLEASQRPSIAILPFDGLGADAFTKTLSEAIPHELIAAISRLRWISVIARGSSFRFHTRTGDFDEIRQRLSVRYCLTGSIEVLGQNVIIGVVLTDTADGQVIWADRFKSTMAEVHAVRETIIAQVIFAVEIQIPLSEAAKARLKSPENIDVWSAYHLGLQSLYRFDESENERAVMMFEKAVAMEPSFARAHAALSFAHFKTAFMHYAPDRGVAVTAARRAAERAIELDPMDPFANFNMGRSLWLVGDLSGAQSWLNRSTSVSPNFAQGIYARAWTETVSGSSQLGRRLSDEARDLSPLDPLLYAMLGTRALGLAMEGRDAEAAEWANRAANAPGAHDLISLIAVISNELAGNNQEAADWARRVREHRHDISQEHFFRSFPFEDGQVRARFSTALARHDIS
ncbi:MAG: winged helix-turn-helix domain-containing tetratricopeptide repeat protein [Hyphomicrobiaceae bacterium]